MKDEQVINVSSLRSLCMKRVFELMEPWEQCCIARDLQPTYSYVAIDIPSIDEIYSSPKIAMKYQYGDYSVNSEDIADDVSHILSFLEPKLNNVVIFRDCSWKEAETHMNECLKSSATLGGCFAREEFQFVNKGVNKVMVVTYHDYC